MTDRQGAPEVGDVWEYPYLWAWQAGRGETEGRKARPVLWRWSIGSKKTEQ